MPYDLISDDRTVPLGDRRYLLSPQDLAGLDAIADLARAGVASLKIEGRLKSPEYVAGITRVYRAALDRLGAEFPSGPAASPADRYELEMSFSRGLHTGWLHGIDNQQLVHARFGKKRGVFVGSVQRVRGDQVFIAAPAAPLKPGDGLVFDAGQPDASEQGGRLYALRAAGAETALTFGRGSVDFARVRPGDRVWKTSDPELDKRLRGTFAGDVPRFQRPVDFEAHGHAGGLLTLIARDGRSGHVARVDSQMTLVPAEHRPLTPETLREPLGRLGGSPFRLGGIVSHLEGAVILPVSELNRLRREAVAQLETLRAQPRRWELREASSGQAAQPPVVAGGRERSPSESLALAGKNVPFTTHIQPGADSLGPLGDRSLPPVTKDVPFTTLVRPTADSLGPLGDRSLPPVTKGRAVYDPRSANGRQFGTARRSVPTTRDDRRLRRLPGACRPRAQPPATRRGDGGGRGHGAL